MHFLFSLTHWWKPFLRSDLFYKFDGSNVLLTCSPRKEWTNKSNSSDSFVEYFVLKLLSQSLSVYSWNYVLFIGGRRPEPVIRLQRVNGEERVQ